MRKNRIFGMLSATALLFAGACSNDVIDPGAQNGSDVDSAEDGVYLAVNFDLPSAKGTRSYTTADGSSSGTEVGRDYENTVSEAYIVLARTLDNSFIAAARSSEPEAIGAANETSYRNTAKFTKTKLSEFYQKLTEDDMEGGKCQVNVFVFANPTSGLSDVLDNAKFGDTDWVNKVGVYEETNYNPTTSTGVIWAKNKFLMSNSISCTRFFPASIDEWNNYTTKTTAFDLSGMNNFGRPNEIDNLTAGNIPVERAAARYDFRDGALDGVSNDIDSENYDIDGPNGFKAQTYHVVLDKDQKALVDVFLGKMSMVNMNKEYYFLRRVSNSGLPTGEGYRLLGPELPWYADENGKYITDEAGNRVSGNYIVDAFADWKATTPTSGFAGHFNYPFFNENGVMDNAETSADSWYTSLISDVLKGEADNTDSWNNDKTKPTYNTWRYLTEGTIPGIDEEQYGISNGIVFKGQLLPAREARDSDDPFTKKLLEALVVSNDGNKLHDPILYVYEGHIYCTWEHIKRMAIYNSLTAISWNEEQNKWDFSINTSNRLYNAVFGTGGFGEITFTCERVPNAELKNADFLVAGEQKLEDPLAQDPTSADYKYNEWKKAFPGSDDEVTDTEAEEMVYFNAFREAAVDKLITLYQTSEDPDLGGWGYYCYYYYWNRHNDNGQDGIMAPMEFAVVRNNVYKLAVTKIARLGHPRISANDPDKPTPNTPDEKGDVYITVTCETLPWVVRENNIVFN